jgi:hypothetical protein
MASRATGFTASASGGIGQGERREKSRQQHASLPQSEADLLADAGQSEIAKKTDAKASLMRSVNCSGLITLPAATRTTSRHAVTSVPRLRPEGDERAAKRVDGGPLTRSHRTAAEAGRGEGCSQDGRGSRAVGCQIGCHFQMARDCLDVFAARAAAERATGVRQTTIRVVIQA